MQNKRSGRKRQFAETKSKKRGERSERINTPANK
jgi:hypothetical protein